MKSALMVLGALALTHSRLWSEEPPVPATTSAPAAQAEPSKSYDALFNDILQSLPEKNRAKVDSARISAKVNSGSAAMPDQAARPDDPPGQEQRDKAMEKLAPEVKKRVEKAIKEIDKRRKEKDQEFKELRK